MCIGFLSTSNTSHNSRVQSSGEDARLVSVQPRTNVSVSVGLQETTSTSSTSNVEIIPKEILTDLEKYIMSVTKILKFEEGFRAKPYLCSEGYVTIGLGTKLNNKKGLDPKDFPLEVGLATAEALLSDEVTRIYTRLESDTYSRIGSIFEKQTQARRDILMSMMYQMGVQGVYKFRNMWNALEAENYEKASDEMLDSAWARQTPARAQRHAQVMLTNSTNLIYKF